MSKDKNNPPTKWGIKGVKKLSNADIYYMFKKEKGKDQLTVWHWCPKVVYGPRYMGQSAGGHTIESKDPLTMSPSLLFDECGLHGFIKGGKWIPA